MNNKIEEAINVLKVAKMQQGMNTMRVFVGQAEAILQSLPSQPAGDAEKVCKYRKEFVSISGKVYYRPECCLIKVLEKHEDMQFCPYCSGRISEVKG
jgi:hypothetical protein